MLKIQNTVLREVFNHAESTYPNECCGLLIGAMNGDTRTVHVSRRCKNLNTERAHDRYEMDPLDQLRAESEFRDTAYEIVGFYHSHPDHPSRPSQTDTNAAHSFYSYVIVSVQKGIVASVNSWVLNETERKFYEEPLVEEGEVK